MALKASILRFIRVTGRMANFDKNCCLIAKSHYFSNIIGLINCDL